MLAQHDIKPLKTTVLMPQHLKNTMETYIEQGLARNQSHLISVALEAYFEKMERQERLTKLSAALTEYRSIKRTPSKQTLQKGLDDLRAER